MDIVLFIVTATIPVTVPVAVAIISRHGIGTIIIPWVPSVRADFTSLIAIVLLVAIAISPGQLALGLVLPIAGSPGENKRRRRRGLLDDDLLRLGALSDDNRSATSVLWDVVLSLLANTFNLMAARIVIALFCAFLNPDLILSATAVPVASSIAVLVAAATVGTNTRSVLTVVIAITIVRCRLKRRARTFRSISPFPAADIQMVSRGTRVA
jgi:hypothetical protein